MLAFRDPASHKVRRVVRRSQCIFSVQPQRSCVFRDATCFAAPIACSETARSTIGMSKQATSVKNLARSIGSAVLQLTPRFLDHLSWSNTIASPSSFFHPSGSLGQPSAKRARTQQSSTAQPPLRSAAAHAVSRSLWKPTCYTFIKKPRYNVHVLFVPIFVCQAVTADKPETQLKVAAATAPQKSSSISPRSDRPRKQSIAATPEMTSATLHPTIPPLPYFPHISTGRFHRSVSTCTFSSPRKSELVDHFVGTHADGVVYPCKARCALCYTQQCYGTRARAVTWGVPD